MKKDNFKKTAQAKLMNYETEHKVYCENCKVCGHWIYRNPKIKLKYEMKERGILK